jgi:hypothetical protein
MLQDGTDSTNGEGDGDKSWVELLLCGWAERRKVRFLYQSVTAPWARLMAVLQKHGALC